MKMPQVSLFRLYLLRAAYLFTAGGLFAFMWPNILQHRLDLPLMTGVAWSMLGAVSIGAAFGLRYPLQMLPVLLFELTWKVIWLAAFAFPLWRAGKVDDATAQSIFECSLAVILIVAIPWGYVFDRYFAKRGDPWFKANGAERPSDD